MADQYEVRLCSADHEILNRYECDRCGTLYKEYDTFAPAYRCKKQGIRIMGYDRENDCWPNIWDLCPACRKEIINMLERKD